MRKRGSSHPSNLESTLSHHTALPGPPGITLMSLRRKDSSTAFLSHGFTCQLPLAPRCATRSSREPTAPRNVCLPHSFRGRLTAYTAVARPQNGYANRPPLKAVGFESYLPARRCQRVAFSIFLCFFFRIRLRRFLISDPMSGLTLVGTGGADPTGIVGSAIRGWCNWQHVSLWS